MPKYVSLFALWMLAALPLAAAYGAEAKGAKPAKPAGTKELSGMSILGNSEAPKSLVIVPWKSSEIGNGIGVANMLDERARPVDKDVFMRELDYYQLRAHSEPRDVSISDARASQSSDVSMNEAPPPAPAAAAP